jgi:hypothetical protein
VAFVVLLAALRLVFAWLIVFACFVSPAALLWLTNASAALFDPGHHIISDPYRFAIESMIYWPFAFWDCWSGYRRHAIRAAEHALSSAAYYRRCATVFRHRHRARAVAETEPVCLYLETTNRCNLLCTTCPRTFRRASRRPTWVGICSLASSTSSPDCARRARRRRADMVPLLPRMIRHLKDRGIYVLSTSGIAR